MKHAYLIMAHNEPYILEKLLKLIDYPDNDIFLHIDKKAKDLKKEDITKWVSKSNLYFIPRMDLRWGTNSLINCTLNLLELAVNHKSYAYYHLISGVDLPLNTQKEMHKFFDKNMGKEFIHFYRHDGIDERRLERVKYYHLFNKNLRSKSKIKRFISNKLYYNTLKIEKLLKINRVKDKKYMFGANWFSITDELANYIISKKKEIEKEYKHTSCCDELFIQTIVYNSNFYDKLYLKKDDDYKASMRCIDWERGEPYTFREEDFKMLMDSKMFFARKFSSTTDKKIIDMIYKEVSNKTIEK